MIWGGGGCCVAVKLKRCAWVIEQNKVTVDPELSCPISYKIKKEIGPDNFRTT